jgi:rRNA-processing arch domain
MAGTPLWNWRYDWLRWIPAESSLCSAVQLDRLSSVRIYIPQDLRQKESRAVAIKALAEVERRFPKVIPIQLAMGIWRDI